MSHKMFTTETNKDQDLMSTLGDKTHVGNLKKAGLHDTKNAQAVFNTFYFQKLAEEVGYMLDSKARNYEHRCKVWFDTN